MVNLGEFYCLMGKLDSALHVYHSFESFYESILDTVYHWPLLDTSDDLIIINAFQSIALKRTLLHSTMIEQWRDLYYHKATIYTRQNKFKQAKLECFKGTCY